MAFDKTSIILAAEDRTRAAFASAKGNVEALGGSVAKMSGLLGGLGVAFSGAQFVGMVKGLIDSADGLNDLATRTGTSVKSLASLQLAAKLADTDLENLGKGLGKLSIFMANNADEAQALGITARDPVEAFAQLADVIAATADPAERNAIAMRVLGKSYVELLPLLVQGGAAIKAQSEASGPYAERMEKLAIGAAKFNDTMDELGQTATTALLPLAQAFTDFAGAALDAAESVEGFDKVLAGLGQAGTVGQTIAVLWANVAFVFDGVGRSIGGIAAQLAALASGDFKGVGAINRFITEDGEKARAELAKLEDRILNFKPTPKPSKPITAAVQNIKVQDILPDAEAQKLQATLAKAFNTKPLDDFIASFADKRKAIEKEYAKLTQSLTAQPLGEVKGFDVGNTISQGQGALARGDTAGVEAATERAKQMLAALQENGGADFELRYYADQLKRFELAVLDAGQSTAEQTRDNLQKNLEQAREQIAAMEPIAIPIAADAIANDLRTALDDIRKDLAANPLTVAVQLANTPGGTAQDLRNAALQAGGRR
jgi:hypothetical protein